MTSLLEEASIKTHQHLQENSNEHIIGRLASKADSLGLHFRVVVVDNAMVIRHQPYITPRTEGGLPYPPGLHAFLILLICVTSSHYYEDQAVLLLFSRNRVAKFYIIIWSRCDTDFQFKKPNCSARKKTRL